MPFLLLLKILPFSMVILCVLEKFPHNLVTRPMIPFQNRKALSLFCMYISSDIKILPERKAESRNVFAPVLSCVFFSTTACPTMSPVSHSYSDTLWTDG
jgi:hypothetical protein